MTKSSLNIVKEIFYAPQNLNWFLSFQLRNKIFISWHVCVIESTKSLTKTSPRETFLNLSNRSKKTFLLPFNKQLLASIEQLPPLHFSRYKIYCMAISRYTKAFTKIRRAYNFKAAGYLSYREYFLNRDVTIAIKGSLFRLHFTISSFSVLRRFSIRLKVVQCAV